MIFFESVEGRNIVKNIFMNLFLISKKWKYILKNIYNNIFVIDRVRGIFNVFRFKVTFLFGLGVPEMW